MNQEELAIIVRNAWIKFAHTNDFSLVTMNQEELAIIVRNAWIKFAHTNGFPPEWQTPYEQLEEWQKEANRQIASTVLKAVMLKVFNQIQTLPIILLESFDLEDLT